MKFAKAHTNAGQTTVQSDGASEKPIQTPKIVINENMNEESPSNMSLICRKFKIFGQIGEPGQTDKLTFVSLTHQIDSGLKRNYKESEIVDTVIRAISLHNSLRRYVETLNDLTLPNPARPLQREIGVWTFINIWQQSINNPKKPSNNFFCALSIYVTKWVLLVKSWSVKCNTINCLFNRLS